MEIPGGVDGDLKEEKRREEREENEADNQRDVDVNTEAIVCTAPSHVMPLSHPPIRNRPEN